MFSFNMADDMDVEVPDGELLLQKHLENKEIERQKLYNPQKYGTPVLSRQSEIVYTPHHEQICVLYFNIWIKRFNSEQIEYFKNSSNFLPIFRERFAKCVFSLSRLINKSVDDCLELLGHEQANPHQFPKEGDHYKKIATFRPSEDKKKPEKIWVDHPEDCCYVGRMAVQILEDFLPEDYKQLMEK